MSSNNDWKPTEKTEIQAVVLPSPFQQLSQNLQSFHKCIVGSPTSMQQKEMPTIP